MSKNEPEWRLFEKAVESFISSIGHGAKVTHDAKIPDAETGAPRQRDVWVEWLFLGHYPMKALISCKYWSSKLCETDIDHFNGEFISSKADIGIMYSRCGYNDLALEKARLLGFHCCMLYRDQAAELPSQLKLGLAFCFYPMLRLSTSGSYKGSKYEDAFRLKTKNGSLRDQIEVTLKKEFSKKDNERWDLARFGFQKEFEVTTEEGDSLIFKLEIKDRTYQAKMECTIINGSYNFMNDQFLGSESSPWINLKDHHPGDDWNEIDITDVESPKSYILFYTSADPEKILNSISGTQIYRI